MMKYFKWGCAARGKARLRLRRLRRLPLAVCALVFFLAPAGCAGRRAGEADDGKLRVCASFYMMYDLCEKVGGGRINLFCLTPSGTEPHDWEPAPSDIITIGSADVFVYHGGVEFWADRALAAVSNAKLTVVRASDAAVPDGLGDDPHTWLDPKLAKLELGEIASAFALADPGNENYYRENFSYWSSELDKLDDAYRDALAGAEGMYIVVSHEAFGYLCAAYGLTQTAVEGLSPDSEPSAGRIARIIDLMRENGIKTVFYGALTSPKAIEQIAEATGAEAAVLDPIEGLTAEGAQNGDDYFSIMYRNLDALRKAAELRCIEPWR